MGSSHPDSHTIGMMFDDFGSYYKPLLEWFHRLSSALQPRLSATEILALYNGGSFP